MSDAIDLILQMVQFDASKRITALNALSHPYFASMLLQDNDMDGQSNPAKFQVRLLLLFNVLDTACFVVIVVVLLQLLLCLLLLILVVTVIAL